MLIDVLIEEAHNAGYDKRHNQNHIEGYPEFISEVVMVHQGPILYHLLFFVFLNYYKWYFWSTCTDRSGTQSLHKQIAGQEINFQEKDNRQKQSIKTEILFEFWKVERKTIFYEQEFILINQEFWVRKASSAHSCHQADIDEW